MIGQPREVANRLLDGQGGELGAQAGNWKLTHQAVPFVVHVDQTRLIGTPGFEVSLRHVSLVTGGRSLRRYFEILANGDEEESLAVLRDPIPDGVKDGISASVAEVGQLLGHNDGVICSSDGEHARHVLHDDGARSPELHRFDELLVQLVPRVADEALLTQAVELAASDP